MFRGIDINTGEWVHGYYVKRLVVFPNKATAYQYGIVAHGNNVKYPPVESREYPVHPDSIAQNTGIQDKNNTPIYGSIEIDGKMSRGGDIVEVFMPNSAYPKRSIEATYRFLPNCLEEYKIIGTQWEGSKIMFRGIDIKTGEWVYGYYVAANMNTHWIVQMNCFGDLLKGLDYPHQVHPDSIAQNTGKKDKYFENIYGSIFIEGRMSKGGDVLEIAKSEIVSVQWNQQVAGFDTEPEISFCDWGWNETCADHLGRVKIIGTQWEGVK